MCVNYRRHRRRRTSLLCHIALLTMVLYHYYRVFYSAGRDQLFLFFLLPIIVMVIRFPWRRCSRHRSDPAANGHCRDALRVVARWPPLSISWEMIYILYIICTAHVTCVQIHTNTQVLVGKKSPRGRTRADVHRKMRIRCINHAPGWWERFLRPLHQVQRHPSCVCGNGHQQDERVCTLRSSRLAIDRRDKNNPNAQWWRSSNCVFVLFVPINKLIEAGVLHWTSLLKKLILRDSVTWSDSNGLTVYLYIHKLLLKQLKV